MSFNDAYKVDFDTATMEISGGAKVTVRRLNCKPAQELRKKLQKPYRHITIPDNVAEEIGNKVLSGAVLVGWDGVTDDAGAPIPYSPAAALALFEKFPDFRDDVLMVANSREAFQAERDAETAKN